MKRLILSTLLALALVVPASAATLKDVISLNAGINGLFYRAEVSEVPTAFEAGFTAAASLSPHISAVGSVFYGFQEAYFRSAVGGRITATDVEDPNFSVGFGAQYLKGGEAPVNEWAADASFGWRPFPSSPERPSQLDPLVVIGQGSVGLTSNVARAILGLRWELPAF